MSRPSRIIGHIDMDAFFASVEERDHPWLSGSPLVIGSDPAGGKGRGIVSTANYLARAYGIHSAMPISTAWKLSEAAKREGKPAAIFTSGRFSKYAEISKRIMQIVEARCQVVEVASVDEAYFDLSFTGSWAKAIALGKIIKKEIKEKEGLTSSVGVAANRMMAKIASNAEKPDGFTVIKDALAPDFLKDLPIRTLPGVGPKGAEELLAMRIRTVGDIQSRGYEKMLWDFGSWGGELYAKAIGEDDQPLVTEWISKSVGEQETFLVDVVDNEALMKSLSAMSKEVFGRFKGEGFESFRTVTLTIRFADFETKNASYTLKDPTKDEKVLALQSLRLLLPFLDKRKNPASKPFRMIGLRIEKFD